MPTETRVDVRPAPPDASEDRSLPSGTDAWRLLRPAAAVLDRAGVAWLILRDPGDGDRRVHEVDILTEPGTFGTVAAILRPLGFREVLEPGRGSHRFLVAYDDALDGWLKLDLVHEVAVGRSYEVPVADARAVLARRTRDQGLPVLCPGDRLWAMLLHRIGDRRPDGGRRPLDPGAVMGAAIHADPASPLASPYAAIRPSGPGARRSGPTAAIDLAMDGRIDELAQMSRMAIDARRRLGRGGWSRAVRYRLRHLARRARSTVTFPSRPGGVIVVLLGPDGAGKTGLAAALATGTPLPVRRRYLGLYGAAGPKRLFGSRGIGRLWWVARSSVVGWLDRRRGRIVVFDRSVDDIAVRGDRKSRLRRAVYRRVAVRPDILLVLDAPGEVLSARRPEHPAIEAERERQRYLALADGRPEATVIDATKPPSKVAASAQHVLWTWLTTHV